MDAQLDGTQTRGMKGIPYDWQALLLPGEPEFSRELKDLLDDEFVGDAGH